MVRDDRDGCQRTTGEFDRARKRKEDARLITGRTRWTDNIVLPGMLHLAVLRSPVTHAVRHYGVTDIEMPCTPQRVWRAVGAARGNVKSESAGATETGAGGGLGSIDAQHDGGAR